MLTSSLIARGIPSKGNETSPFEYLDSDFLASFNASSKRKKLSAFIFGFTSSILFIVSVKSSTGDNDLFLNFSRASEADK